MLTWEKSCVKKSSQYIYTRKLVLWFETRKGNKNMNELRCYGMTGSSVNLVNPQATFVGN